MFSNAQTQGANNASATINSEKKSETIATLSFLNLSQASFAGDLPSI